MNSLPNVMHLLSVADGKIFPLSMDTRSVVEHEKRKGKTDEICKDQKGQEERKGKRRLIAKRKRTTNIRESQNQRACFKYFISTCVGKAHRTRRRHPHCPPIFFFLFLFGIVNKTRDVYERGGSTGRNLAKEDRTASRSLFMSILFHSEHGYFDKEDIGLPYVLRMYRVVP